MPLGRYKRGDLLLTLKCQVHLLLMISKTTGTLVLLIKIPVE